LLKAIKKLFFWNFARNTWQWDILCVVILIFIFLTPKSWFENSERRSAYLHQSPIVSTLLVGPELIENAKDKGEIEQRVRALTGRRDIRVLDVRKVVDRDGKPKAYEVDIR
jgi:L-asparagine transporter-like permease